MRRGGEGAANTFVGELGERSRRVDDGEAPEQVADRDVQKYSALELTERGGGLRAIGYRARLISD